MRPDRINQQRLIHLEEILEIEYEKLGEFQKELDLSASANANFELRQRIKREILPSIRKHEVEYGELLAKESEAFLISEPDAETAIIQVTQAVEHLESSPLDKYPDEMRQLLMDIREKLEDPGKTAAAKLKVALPVIPLIASYEMELDTEASIVRVWRGIKTLFSNKA
ncbi:hypothetical protein [Leptolyngbya sp. FACHB-261]|uniref:hypothetical protein n=1 Tax=Leptolyngbya sp. FACHB-261 TaxID=2692806 RepID=UPI0016885734|nr:hypothetical protein [Leptolyngbya sp. FACHB-261]MBD2099721.1 hypothetical protein [Leptolyngbya sp. FACHB-261]